MRQFAVILAALMLLCVSTGRVEAGRVVIDFEEFKNTDNVDGINLGGVTLNGPNGRVEIFDNRFGALYHSGTKSIACPDGIVSLNPLIAVFDQPVNYISLWGGDSGTYVEADSWELRAYDAPTGGNLVGLAKSGSWNGYPYRQLEVEAETIWRFEAVWTGTICGIGYDDLCFQPVPEPSLLLLAAAGLLILPMHTARRGACS